MQNVIVYDTATSAANTYYVPAAWVLQLTATMTLQQALAFIAGQILPAGAINIIYTTVDQLPTLGMAQQQQVAILYAACEKAITGGYPSSALGTAYTYPSKPTDQTNMMGSVTNSLLPNLPSGWTTPFWCADQSGNWAMRDHTASQIQQAGLDGKTFILTQQLRLNSLVVQVAQATTVQQIQAITW